MEKFLPISFSKTFFQSLLTTKSILILLSLLCLISSFKPFNLLLAYQQVDFIGGQYWRPLTGWIAQLNVQHWFLNQWGLIIMIMLLPKTLSMIQVAGFVVIWLVSSSLLAISDYSNYVGLSGLLYGWLIYSAFLSPYYKPWVKSVFTVVLSYKVLSENGWLPQFESEWVSQFIGANIAYKSHLWGLIAGYIAIALVWIHLLLQSKRVHRDQ